MHAGAVLDAFGQIDKSNKRTMSNRQSSLISGLNAFYEELRENFSLEIVGLFFVLIGAFALISLRGDPNPWLRQMVGWSAPLFALSLIAVGVVLMLRERRGYWSAEALVGAELFLLALMVATFLRNNDVVTWQAPGDGSDGGLVGWAIGSMLMATLGRWPAFLLVLLIAAAGLFLLLRYTPLIYGVHGAGRLAPQFTYSVFGLWQGLSGRRSPGYEEPLDFGESPNFVTADPELVEEPTEVEPSVVVDSLAGKRSSSGSKQPRSKAKTSPSSKRSGKSVAVRSPEQLPPPALLEEDSGIYGNADVRALEQLIESTLDDFNVPVKVVHVETGPTVTQFGVEPQYMERAGQRRKVRVSRIVNLADDLALALAARAVRIEAPVPGRPYVGIEVPNTEKTLVGMKGLLESRSMQREGGALALPLGRNTAGDPVIIDLTRAPHLLIAGATGSGKSVCINSIICGLLMRHGPESLRFVMVDPKMVELPGYNGIPHLLGKVIIDVDQVMASLTWLLLQMDDRYQLFRDLGVRNIDAYNALARRRKSLESLPYIVLVIDELADLMMTAGEDVERQICRLAQMARATGIHLVLATQRPSTDVVTGLIKANFPTRIAFAVTSQVDSRVVLDGPGAERLLGGGDMLLMRPDVAKLARVQGCFVSDKEIGEISRFWKTAETDVEQSPVAPWNGLMDRLESEDELILDAIDVVRDMQTCSASMLQRRLRIGYPKAARLMEELESRGVVGPDQGGGQGRKVLLQSEEDNDLDDEDSENSP